MVPLLLTRRDRQKKSSACSLVFSTGFSLIELLVTISIVGLIAGFGISQYRASLVESRRNEAMSMIMAKKMTIEGSRAEKGIYPPSDPEPTKNTGTFYKITYAQTGSGSGYNIEANAITGSSQDSDTGCTKLWVTNLEDDVQPLTCF